MSKEKTAMGKNNLSHGCFLFPKNANIQEILVNWDIMVAFNFPIPNDNRYFCLFAGIGIDGNYHFELSIIDTLEDDHFYFRQEDNLQDIIVPIDFFAKKTTVAEQISTCLS